MKRIDRVLVVAAFMVATPHAVGAQDASFGCKVLLCAAASAPDWSGIPYCVPVMTKLFKQLAHGGSWPICSGVSATGLSNPPYLARPASTTATRAAENRSLRLIASPEGNLCADASKPPQVCEGARYDLFCAVLYPTISRPVNSEPYLITSANGAQRFNFSLRGY
jgi:hypothetical protein